MARIYGVIDIACDVVYGDEHDTTCGEVVHSNTHNDRYDAMHGVIQDDICGLVYTDKVMNMMGKERRARVPPLFPPGVVP